MIKKKKNLQPIWKPLLSVPSSTVNASETEKNTKCYERGKPIGGKFEGQGGGGCIYYEKYILEVRLGTLSDPISGKSG